MVKQAGKHACAQNYGIAYVCSYSQSLDQFGFPLVFRNLNSIHIRKGTAVPFLTYNIVSTILYMHTVDIK